MLYVGSRGSKLPHLTLWKTVFVPCSKYCLSVDKQLEKWYAKGNIYVEVVNLSRAKYPNRDALRQANDIYLDAMYPFVRNCLDKVQGTTTEKLIRDALRLAPADDIEEKIEISDIAHLIRTYWYDFFEGHFDAVDRHYEARSAIGLIVEGRNRASHRPWDLDPGFTRTQLFLIAEVLGKINMPDAQHEVGIIRDKLFNDTTEQLVTMAVEAEKTTYEKSIAEVEKRLAASEESSKELSKRIVDNTTELDKKEKKLEKLSEQLMGVKLSEKENEKHLNSISKQLKKVQAAHSTCEERFTTISNQFTAAEAERDDYRERFETASKEREEVETEWQACEDSLVAVRNLFMTATIGNQEVQAVFPSFETDSTVRILDRRDVDKQNYLLNLLEQKQPIIIYVQSEEMVDLLLERVVPEKADVIERHGERTSEAEEAEIFEKLEKGELIAVVSNTAFSTLTPSHGIEHFVFCHLVPGLDEFFKQCEPAFTSEKNTCLHLIYNSEQDIKGLAQKYPDREALEKLYPELRKLAGTNGDFIRPENVYNELDIAKPGIETGLAIFEELQLLERNDEGIRLLPPAGKKLDASEIYRRGEQLKNGAAGFQVFQFEQSIEQIWEALLKELNVDNEQILEASSVYEVRAFPDAIEDSGAQSEPSTDAVENDSKSDTEVSEAQSEPSTIAERYVTETTEEHRNSLAVQIAEMRINATGSKPIAWKSIREKFDLKDTQFHKIIRLSKGYRDAVIARIKQLKAAEGGWKYNGKLSALTGIKDIENYLE